MKKHLIFFLAFAALPVVHATDYYVSGTGSDTNNGLSTTSPFATIQKAADLTNPGDTVYIMNGTYNQVQMRYGDWLTVLNVDRSGTASAYITYTNYPGHSPVISAENCRWNCITVFANYIKIQGLEIVGRNASDSLTAAEARYNSAVAATDSGGTPDWSAIGRWDMNAVCINQGGNGAPKHHHIEIRNCIIHDFSAAGIGTTNSDYVTLEGNTVYNNSWYTMWATSGITYGDNLDIDDTLGYKLITRGNKVYNNYCLVKWFSIRALSDGNGIIIDVHSQYNGGHLVENNVVWNNGGRGLYIMKSKNALFRNNISYWNSKSSFSYGGEMVVYDSSNVKYVNNIAWANPAYSSSNFALTDDGAWGNNSNIVWKNNLTFNGTVGNPSVRIAKTTTTSIDSTNKLGVNPLLTSPGTSATADFRPQSNSPVINAGTSAYGVSTTDLDGAVRVQGTAIDLGAYELPDAAPVITAQPQAVSVTSGASFSLSVTASGDALTYQWYLGSSAINGATASSYSKNSATATDAGNYTVMVTNASGSTTSSVAAVTVTAISPPPSPAPSSGGGGGAPSIWFMGIMSLLALARHKFRKN